MQRRVQIFALALPHSSSTGSPFDIQVEIDKPKRADQKANGTVRFSLLAPPPHGFVGDISYFSGLR